MKLWLHRLTAVTQLCLEANCPLCQRSTVAVLCPNCQQQLQRMALPHPAQRWQPPLPVFAWGQYGGTLKRTLAALKYSHQPQLAAPLGEALAESWLKSSLPAQLSAMPPKILVVPIPMHPEKQRQRGFNQAELIARAFCQSARLPLVEGLSRQRNTVPQFGLSAAERAENLAAAFELAPGFRGAKFGGSRGAKPSAVLLLDDIYTTGATALVAAQTLRRHQISVYGILTVARAGNLDKT